LLALSFSSSQLTENQAARNFNHAARAEEIALGGLETAVAVLREDARGNSYDDLFERWAIYYPNDDGFAYDSGGSVSGSDWEKAADLSDYDELEYDVDKSGDLQTVRRDPWKEEIPDSRWIYVPKDPKLTRLPDDLAEKRKLSVGRYAVCIEDENGKVNINTAGNPDPTEVKNNYRWRHRSDMGFTTAEVDLGEVFQSLGELFHDAVPGIFDYKDYPHNVDERTALDMVTYRYGHDPAGDDPEGTRGKELNNYVPGTDRDDNSTSSMPVLLRQSTNGIDDDADGLIDETIDGKGEEIDEPGEFDPYEPMAIGAPGEVLSDYMDKKGTAGVMGNDTPFLTVPHIRMAWRTGRPDSSGQLPRYSIMDLRPSDVKPPYPADALYRCLLPFITVYSQDLNRVTKDLSSGGRGKVEWATRTSIGEWLEEGPRRIERDLRDLKFDLGTGVSIEQIAVNLYDFIDPDWFPTKYGDVVGIEPTVYLNEVEAAPREVSGAEIGIEGWVLDWGEWIELWNPYEVAIDVSRYCVTIDQNSDQRGRQIGPMAVRSTVVPPHGFFIIGDTRGYVQNTGGTGIMGEQSNLPPRPANCDAYAPLKLDAPLKMVLEIEAGRDRRLVEPRSDVPVENEPASAQKDDPRVGEWHRLPATPRSINTGMTNRDEVFSYFYMPGVRSRGHDPNFNPSNQGLLEHAGALSSIGELGMAHRGKPWESLNFTGVNGPGLANRDDSLLLDLLALPYQYVYAEPDSGGIEYSYSAEEFPVRESVPGRININTASPDVLLGLNWMPMIADLASYGLRVGPGVRLDFIRHIIQRRKDAPYEGLWEVAEDIAEFMEKRAGLANAPEAAKEAFMRYNANLITTKSNIFKVTVVAEVFDRAGNTAASRKLDAVVDRGYTPGSLGRSGEDNPTRDEKARAETARTLYFRWVTEER
jgi:hypothetical protein